MIAFRSCFHLLTFPIQSATQSGTFARDTELGFGAFWRRKKQVKHPLQSSLSFSLFCGCWQTQNRRKALIKSIASRSTPDVFSDRFSRPSAPMSEERNWKRIRERLPLQLPVRVRGRETPTFEWNEITRLDRKSTRLNSSHVALS